MTMAHRADTGAAVVSSHPTPRPDPGDADAMSAAFDDTVSAAYRAAEARFWRWVQLILVAVLLAAWLVFEFLQPAGAREPGIPPAVVPPAVAPAPTPMPTPGPVLACAAHAEIVSGLRERYAEHPRSIAVDLAGRLVELFLAKDGVTWTVVVTRGDGWSCIVAVGESWEFLPEPVAEGPRA